MASFRGKNLRSGDIAESVAIVMMQSFALVAPVPRTEDVGTDAVVTLLRKYDKTRLIAEDSFFVQIKSESVSDVTYEGDQVGWLYSLDLPLFFASVNQTTGTLKLYCAHELSEAYIMNHERTRFVIEFTDKSDWNDLPSRNDERVSIGPPVFEWTLSQCADSNVADRFYEIIKGHVQIAKDNLRTRKLGWVNYLAWTTNEPLKKGLLKSSRSRPPAEHLDLVYNEMVPCFTNWAFATIGVDASDQIREIEKLMASIKTMASTFKRSTD